MYFCWSSFVRSHTSGAPGVCNFEEDPEFGQGSVCSPLPYGSGDHPYDHVPHDADGKKHAWAHFWKLEFWCGWFTGPSEYVYIYRERERHACTCVHMYTCAHMRKCMRAYLYVNTPLCIRSSIYICVNVHLYMYIYIYICVHACVYIYIYVAHVFFPSTRIPQFGGLCVPTCWSPLPIHGA